MKGSWHFPDGPRRRPQSAASWRWAIPVAALLLTTGCSTVPDDTGEVTRTSLSLLEEGRTKAAAGDFAGARDAFAAAATNGGLQPDFYCAARLEQANCESRLGNHDAALALLDEVTAGAADFARIQELRIQFRARRGSGQPATQVP